MGVSIRGSFRSDMKILCVFILYLVNAERHTINTELLELIFEHRNLTGKLFDAIKPAYEFQGTHGRNVLVNDITRDVASSLATYGCWCSRLSTGTSSGGHPVDDVDNQCRSWAQCRFCEKFSGCNGDIDFNYTADVIYGANGLELACPATLNECTKDRCLCDLEYGLALADTLYELLDGDNPPGLDPTKLDLTTDQCGPIFGAN